MNILTSEHKNTPITDTNMMVDLIANPEKIIGTDDRWTFNKNCNEVLNELDHKSHILLNDDEHSEEARVKYENIKKNSDNHNLPKQPEKIFNTCEKVNIEQSNETLKTFATKEDAELKEKLDIMCKLWDLEQQGVKLSQRYTISSSLESMKFEHDLHKKMRDRQTSIQFMKQSLLTIVYGIATFNDYIIRDPFKIKLEGWANQVNSEVGDYYEILCELYEKYKPGKESSPELKLGWMLISSVGLYVISNYFSQKSNYINTDLITDNELLDQLRDHARENKIKKGLEANEKIQEKMKEEHKAVSKQVTDLNLFKEKRMAMLKKQQENQFNQVKRKQEQEKKLEEIKKEINKQIQIQKQPQSELQQQQELNANKQNENSYKLKPPSGINRIFDNIMRENESAKSSSSSNENSNSNSKSKSKSKSSSREKHNNSSKQINPNLESLLHSNEQVASQESKKTTTDSDIEKKEQASTNSVVIKKNGKKILKFT